MRKKRPDDYRHAIQASGLSIDDAIAVGHPDLWIPTHHLETLLSQRLAGLSLSGLALRTRSKAVKAAVCAALGYPVPKSFKRTQPRFFGQHLDVYAQKALNLQIWNEALADDRRYAIIQIREDDSVGAVRVVTGQQLALLDTTGTLTTKYQARLERGATAHELVSARDTELLRPHTHPLAAFAPHLSPATDAVSGTLLPIATLFERLSPLVGTSFADPGRDQERNRGAALHRLVCAALGYGRYDDPGQFPDVRHQLLEVKLQTSPTIDLGLVLPSSPDLLDVRPLDGHAPRYCDARYALFLAATDGVRVTLTGLAVTTGADFFRRFRRFEGKVENRKLQIPLGRVNTN